MQGNFYECKSESQEGTKTFTVLHHYHRQCQVYKYNKYFCPHCAKESKQYLVLLKPTGPPGSWTSQQVAPPDEEDGKQSICPRFTESTRTARMGFVLQPSMLKEAESQLEKEICVSVPATDKTISSSK